ncbi:restriction endonuclease subunit S, partial [Thiolapillus sp.]|uniref:restriction endonuclease subunit S n=1 Tax=Thiolapillus sp. TaxID=2017437 RepID=UPI0025D83435
MSSKSDKKKSLVPRLRFPEFREAGAWEVKELGEIASISNGLTADQSGDSNGLKVTRIETISEGCIDISKVGYIDRIEGVERFGLRIGDILFSHINSQSHIGKTALVEEDFDLYHGMNLLRLQVDKTENNPRFTYYLLNTEFFRKSVQARSNQAVNQASINQTEVGNSQIAVPSAKEQQKIAHCLSSLDEVIGLQAKKVQALKRHKKGLMQQLFPAEGETTTPRLRFPEFREAGAWEVRRLGEIGKISKGKGISKSDIKPNGALPCIRYGELYTHYGEVIRDVVSFTDANPGNLVLSEENDVIIPASGETKEDIATASCVSVKGVALGGDLNIFYSPMNGMFLAYYIRGNLKFEISKVAQGNSVVHLYTTQLEKLKLAVPPYPKEQQKIAHCLSSLDEVIGLESDKLDALKNLKKGLMQQLFPQ